MYGERIREIREELGYSQLDLAVLLSTSLGNIQAWEEEKKSPSVDELILLSEELNTTIDWIAGIVDDDSDLDEDKEECDEDLFEEDLSFEDLEEPITNKNFPREVIVPHMKEYRANYKRAIYIHIQLSESDESDDCIIYSGDTADVLAATNLIIKGMSDKIGADYYDMMVMMASAHARTELGIEDK